MTGWEQTATAAPSVLSQPITLRLIWPNLWQDRRQAPGASSPGREQEALCELSAARLGFLQTSSRHMWDSVFPWSSLLPNGLCYHLTREKKHLYIYFCQLPHDYLAHIHIEKQPAEMFRMEALSDYLWIYPARVEL